MPHRPVHRRLLLLALLPLTTCLPSQAQETAAATATETAAYAPRTGDDWIDRALADIGDYAARYPDGFVDEVSRYLDVPRDYAEAMLAQPGWRAGDIHFACNLAKVAGRACREVVRAWSRDHENGWRGVAKDFEVPPGAAGYRQIRETIRASYAHWARPLPQ
ncbi:MAG: hypothetical protein QM761_03250 [Pseudoxanthomonas sp.]